MGKEIEARREQERLRQQQKQQEEEDRKARARVEEKAAVKQRLEALEQKQLSAAAARIQARFRGLKDRTLNKGRFASLVDLKVAREKEIEARREQERLREQLKQQEEEERK